MLVSLRIRLGGIIMRIFDAARKLGNEEVQMACSSSLTSWVARSARAFQLDVISCIASDLKEKGALRMGYLHFLQPSSFHCVRTFRRSLPLVFISLTPMSRLIPQKIEDRGMEFLEIVGEGW
ncbi:protein ILITYHIA-like isoform X2 [Coffea arabica]|uniref:Protein ILITYHIA-like isoform X2 n=1 Tax=Coffea arabica TaxID=13443 RepID=A0ABM4VY53_COFAR